MNLRQWIESIVFAGLKPHDPRNVAPPPQDTWLQRLLARIDKFVTGGAPQDPLYLTNRTWSQKIRVWSMIAVPLALFGIGVVLLLASTGRRHGKPAAELSPAEVAARSLPNLRDVKVDSNHSLDVMEISIVRNGDLKLAGLVKNRTDHEIEHAELGCDLTDTTGTRLESVTVELEKIPAAGAKTFAVPLKPTEAQAVLVREIMTR